MSHAARVTGVYMSQKPALIQVGQLENNYFMSSNKKNLYGKTKTLSSRHQTCHKNALNWKIRSFPLPGIKERTRWNCSCLLDHCLSVITHLTLSAAAQALATPTSAEQPIRERRTRAISSFFSENYSLDEKLLLYTIEISWWSFETVDADSPSTANSLATLTRQS